MKQKKDEFLIGRKPVLEAFAKSRDLEKVWIDLTIRGEFEKELRHTCKKHGVPLISSPPSKLNELVKNKTHQGVVAQLSLVKYQNLADVVSFLYEKGEIPRIILLDGVEDVRNLGAIARSAHWFGFQAMVVPMKESARMNAFAMKASMGALAEILVCREKTIHTAVETLQASGIRVFGASMHGKSLQEADFSGPVGLVLGSEEKGIHASVEKKCDQIVKIGGHPDKMESLNVSVAAAILMHEVFRHSD